MVKSFRKFPAGRNPLHWVDPLSAHLRNYIVGTTLWFVGLSVLNHRAQFRDSLFIPFWAGSISNTVQEFFYFGFTALFLVSGFLLVGWNSISGFFRLIELVGSKSTQPKKSLSNVTFLLSMVVYVLTFFLIFGTLGAYAAYLVRAE
ncbi:hypothetical protein RA27_22590 [Ruegeria sp. ANG-R]|uniref:hypothetical protein n=1 Tax=Ruegeria sp. ANG-R TaxID=1577903 RepID=UPI00057F9BE1|nr:hypothetical protein [Ruegeria sp. ANG-R]KIC35709.1 hypothetical protein RA27_22590 [Ruegeria sp. ANG-R]